MTDKQNRPKPERKPKPKPKQQSVSDVVDELNPMDVSVMSESEIGDLIRQFLLLPTSTMRYLIGLRMAEASTEESDEYFDIEYRDRTYRVYPIEVTVNDYRSARQFVDVAQQLEALCDRFELNGEQVEIGDLPFPLVNQINQRWLSFMDVLGMKAVLVG